jgi:hypothetical protein
MGYPRQLPRAYEYDNPRPSRSGPAALGWQHRYVITFVITVTGEPMSTNASTPRFKAAPARIGNARGYRIAAGLFRDHPELKEGEFEATYLGSGVVLLYPAVPGSSRASEEIDPVMAAYLAWTEQAMQRDPASLRPMTPREFEIAAALVDGVEVDLETDRLPDDFELP